MCKKSGIGEAVHEVRERVVKLEHAVNGNGRPGILERLAGLEKRLDTQTWLLRTVAISCMGIILKQWFG